MSMTNPSALQATAVNQNLLQDQAVKSSFLNNPAYTGVTGISPFLNSSTLGGVGLDALSSLGVTGLSGGSDNGIADVLKRTDGLFALGLQMSPPGSLAQTLAQKAVVASQQSAQASLQNATQQEAQLSKTIALKKRLGLPVSEQEKQQATQLKQQLAQLQASQQGIQPAAAGGSQATDLLSKLLSALGMGSMSSLLSAAGGGASSGQNPLLQLLAGLGGGKKAA